MSLSYQRGGSVKRIGRATIVGALWLTRAIRTNGISAEAACKKSSSGRGCACSAFSRVTSGVGHVQPLESLLVRVGLPRWRWFSPALRRRRSVHAILNDLAPTTSPAKKLTYSLILQQARPISDARFPGPGTQTYFFRHPITRTGSHAFGRNRAKDGWDGKNTLRTLAQIECLPAGAGAPPSRLWRNASL